jgi:hypothetical protein
MNVTINLDETDVKEAIKLYLESKGLVSATPLDIQFDVRREVEDLGPMDCAETTAFKGAVVRLKA